MLLRPAIQNMESSFMFDGVDKTVHLSIFTWLGFCFVAAFPRVKFSTFFYIMLIYSILTEILQDEMALGRSLEGLDLVADTFGVLLGYIVFRRLEKLKHWAFV
jgi:hypothetical protein